MDSTMTPEPKEPPGPWRWLMDSEEVSSSLLRSSIEQFASLEAYTSKYGDMVDMIGYPYLSRVWQVDPNGKPYSFQQRCLVITDVHSPYYAYTIAKLPEYALIVTGVTAPNFGAKGGAREVRFFYGGELLTVAECVELGILKGRSLS